MAHHLSDAELLDLAEGVADEQSYPHLASCGECRAQLQDARAALTAVNGVEVPEPSPLFWEHLSARVHDAVAAEQASGNRPPDRWFPWRIVAPLGAAAAVVVVAMSVLPRTARNAPVNPPPATIDAGAGLSDTPIADDASLSFVADLASDLDWEGAAQAGLATGPGAIDGVLPTLSDSETAELERILTDALARHPARGGV
ncbi:MAG TPA: hypothetical protein VH417_05750 [Vicinamibacterales bacterium]